MLIDYDNLSHVVNGIGLVNVLNWLGFSNVKDDYSTVRAACKVHGGDRRDSFCMYKNTLVWKCFSKKCEETHGESFFSLVSAVLGVPFKEAVSSFCSNFAVSIDSFVDSDCDISDYKFKSLFNCYKRSIDNEPNNEPVVFPRLVGPSDYFETDRGGPFLATTILLFGINSYYVDKDGRKRVFIPINDVNGNLITYSGRAEDELGYRKYYNCFDYESSNVLYNLDKAKNTESRYIIVVEGFKSVWRLYEYGYNNVVSSLGSMLKPGQVKLLIPLFKDVIIFYDADDAGIKGAEISVNKYKNIIDIAAIIYESDSDPADMSEEAINKLLTKFK
jgi:hypothetical protein